MNIFNKVNKLIPKQLYSTSKHNVLALVFVLLVILVVQYPSIFSKSANTVFGKAIILLIIILLTNYNTIVGLAATIVALVFYVYLFDTGYEGLENMDTAAVEKKDENAPKPNATGTNTGTGISSTPSAVVTSTNPLIEPSAPPAIAAPATPVPVATPVANNQPTQTDIMLAASQATASQPSGALPSTNVQNPNVQPSESTGNAKSTSNAISSPLMPAPATVTALSS